MDKKEWKIFIGTRHYYLTDKEKDYYLKSLSEGNDYCALRNGLLILPKNMQGLHHIAIEEQTEKLDKGMYQCPFNKWHTRNAECLCDREYEIVDGVAREKVLTATTSE